MIDRQIEPILSQMAAQFKAVAVTGPRQSGKTTLTLPTPTTSTTLPVCNPFQLLQLIQHWRLQGHADKA
jgi:predicted AAA+ superfamily ATPase